MATPFDPVQIAFERAIDDFRSQLKDDAVYDEILQITSIQQVYDATDKLQAEQSKNGRLRHLSKIEPYLARLSDYTDAAGIFIQAKPDVLALIWGPVVLLLQWASVLKTSFDAIVNTTAEIGSALPEFHQAIQIFDQNNQIKDVLLFFFKDILDFYLVALRFFRLPRKRTFPLKYSKCCHISPEDEAKEYPRGTSKTKIGVQKLFLNIYATMLWCQWSASASFEHSTQRYENIMFTFQDV